MEPINFEEDIRKKLQEREIAPSEGAWAQLDAQLAATDAYKKTSFPWLAVAASFVGILIIASVWFSQTADSATTEIVSEEIINQPENEDVQDAIPQKEIFMEEVVNAAEEQTEVAVEEVQQKEVKTPTKVSEEKSSVPRLDNRVVIAEQAVAKNETTQKIENKNPQQQVAEKIVPQTIESQTVAQVVAQVKAMQNEQGAVSPEDIDQLLSKARKDMSTQRMLSSEKIDPAALLLDVELDLEQSFRDKVFDALGTGFEKIRTAVVERNN